MLGAFSFAERWLKGPLDRVGKNAVRGLQAALTEEPPPPGRSRLTDLQDRLIVPGLVGFTNVGYLWHKRNWKPLAVSLRGRTVVITGATSGLGRAAASQLADLGARVILVGRDPDKAEAARREIVATTGNDDVAVALADLSLLADVRKLAQTAAQGRAPDPRPREQCRGTPQPAQDDRRGQRDHAGDQPARTLPADADAAAAAPRVGTVQDH